MWKLMENIIDKDDINSLIHFLQNSDRFTNGPNVVQFEEEWSNWLGVNRSVMVNSGASANFTSIAIVKELFGIGEVIVPSLGWSSDVSSIVQLGMTPVFVDIDPNTLGLNPTSLKNAISDQTKAVVIVHALGFNAITEEVKNILTDRKIFVIEDCCESHGALLDIDKNIKIGTFGNLSLFSFYFGHHITTIEGGMVCTKDEKLYQLAKMFRSHGMTREASTDIKSEFEKNYPDLNPLFTFALAGFNFRSTEINAVLGLSQIKKLDLNIAKRTENLKTWLDNLDGNFFQTSFNDVGSSNFALPLILKDKNKNLFKKICYQLNSMNVEYRLGTAGGGNLSRQPFLKKYEHKITDNQNTVNHVHEFGLYVGNGSHVGSKRIKEVVFQLNKVAIEVGAK